MAETLVEKGICASCGSEVRDGSSFCYNCGESIIPEPLPPAILKPPTGTLNGQDGRNDKTLEFHDPEPPPVAVPLMPLDPPVPVEDAPSKEERLSKQAFPAAARRPRHRTMEPVEVEWTERPPTVARFIIAAILIAAIVAGLIAAAAYLR